MNNMKNVKTNKKPLEFMDGIKEYFKDRGKENVRVLEGFEANIQHDVVYLDKLKEKAKAIHFRLDKISEMGKQKNDIKECLKNFDKVDKEAKNILKEYAKVEKKLGENPIVEKIKKAYSEMESMKYDIKNEEDKNHLYKSLKRLVSVWKSDTSNGRKGKNE